MGNTISTEQYDGYVRRSHDLLKDISANFITKRLREMSSLDLVDQNGQMLYWIAVLVHILYGHGDQAPPVPPDAPMKPQEYLEYELALLSHVRSILFNTPATELVQNVRYDNLDRFLKTNLITFCEISKVIKPLIKEYGSLVINDVRSPFEFKLGYVDFTTTATLRISSRRLFS